MKNFTNVLNGETFSKKDIRQTLKNALDEDEKIEFLVEEFLKTEGGEHKIPDDYKFYMFNGKVACIQVITRVNKSEGYTSWYDENWNPLPNLTTNYPDGEEHPVPACFSKMRDTSILLSKSYKIFVRIDFYATDKGVVFGEFSPTPAVGKGFTKPGDKLLTEYWDKYCRGMI
jgi:hypothetical protein